MLVVMDQFTRRIVGFGVPLVRKGARVEVVGVTTSAHSMSEVPEWSGCPAREMGSVALLRINELMSSHRLGRRSK